MNTDPRLAAWPRAVALFITCIAGQTFAAQGEPVAVIQSTDGFTIQSMWNLSVSINKSGSGDGNSIALYQGSDESDADKFLVSVDASTPYIDKVFDRFPNRDRADYYDARLRKACSENHIRFRVNQNVVAVTVDGVNIVHLRNVDQIAIANQMYEQCDVLLFGGKPDLLADTAKQLNCRIAIAARSHDTIQQLKTNTIAITASKDSPEQPRLVSLQSKPTELSDELSELFNRKEKACKDSQAVFAKLTTNQMNFKPSNGTHTPRWNTEHMMGRELLFFSQIFHARDPSIPVMNLNPKQMPPDYKAKHPDWSGAEEARQMQRVSDFTRRFAYLLNGMDLDQKAPSSFWTPRKLLLQMERHYSEHTTNTQKKFDLPDWPKK